MATDWNTQGKANRKKGGQFEREVREELVKDGWVVDKFSGQIEVFIQDEEICGGGFIKAKGGYNPYRKMVCAGTGFPDFICFKKSPTSENHEIKFVECKTNGRLSKQEKLKMEWLESEGFECWVASEDENEAINYEKPKRAKKIKKKVAA